MATTSLRELLPAWTIGPATGHRNLTLVPLIGGRPRLEGYLLAAEAIVTSLLTVTEVSDSGTVPELLAVNTGDQPVLLIDGEELKGAKQNRILNTSVLLPRQSKTKIPVSCVEEGRWSHVSPAFTTGHYAPTSLRQRKSRDVHYSLRASGRAASDQGAVWDSVARQIGSLAIGSPTRALSDAMDSQADVFAGYCAALTYPAGACGVIAAVSGRFAALDAFDSPATLEAIWPRLVSSYAMDAQASSQPDGRQFTGRSAEMLLSRIAGQQAETFNAVGRGQDLRFEAPDVIGQALCVDDRLLHLSVFPPTGDETSPRDAGPRFHPPSRRRRPMT